MTKATTKEVGSALANGMKAAVVDAGSADEAKEVVVKASGATPVKLEQLAENTSGNDHDEYQDDYIVSYCMCLHEPSSARAEHRH
jgi:hypothetical protein